MVHKKGFIILTILLLCVQFCFGQNPGKNIIGNWAGSCLSDRSPLIFAVNIRKIANNYTATFSSPDQRALDIPLQKLKYDSLKNEISFSLIGDADAWNFTAAIKNNKMIGTVKKGEQQEPFKLLKQKHIKPNYTKVDTVFKNEEVTLAGTLYLPKVSTKVPAIVFIHGSGSEPRFASAYYADYFAKNGIAVLIYDKRGVNKSGGNWRNATFVDLAKDAIAGVKLLESLPQVNDKKIGIYGHSQGGSICPLALNMYPKIAFGISAASAGVSMEESDWYEVQNRFKNYVSGQDYANAMKVMQKYLQFASSGKGYDALVETAKKYESTDWFNKHIGKIDTTKFFFSYYRKIGSYNAVNYWQSVKQPVLIIKGGNDLTSPGYPSFANIEKALQLAGNKHYKIIVFPNSTHEMHLVGKPSDFWFKGTPEYCETILSWLKGNIVDK